MVLVFDGTTRTIRALAGIAAGSAAVMALLQPWWRIWNTFGHGNACGPRRRYARLSDGDSRHSAYSSRWGPHPSTLRDYGAHRFDSSRPRYRHGHLCRASRYDCERLDDRADLQSAGRASAGHDRPRRNDSG